MNFSKARLLAGAACCSWALLAGASAKAAEWPFGRLIVFGDSISDSGAYADKAPEGAGRFTTNPDPVWVEIMANSYGLSLTSSAVGGLNFAEGGARVAQPRDDAPGDLSRTPVVDQVDKFLSQGTFRPDDLVIIQGGGNDVFATQTNGLDFTPADLAVLEAAAGDLAGLLGKVEQAGAQWLVTTSVPMFEPFNAYYRDALAAAEVNLLYFDTAALIDEIRADPATYGLVNITDPACKGSAVQSFRCLPEDLVTPDANTSYLHADRVHFTGIVHQMMAEATIATVNAVHQADAAAQLIHAAEPASAAWLTAPSERGISLTGSVSGARLNLGGHFLDPTANLFRFNAGVTGSDAINSAGIGLGYQEADGSVGPGSSLGWHGLGLHAFYERRMGRNRLRLDGGWSKLGNVELARRFAIGPATREEIGETDGSAEAATLTLAREYRAGNLRVEPSLSIGWRKTQLKGWIEESGQSTSIAVDDLVEETGELGVGLAVAPAEPGTWSPFGSARFYRTLWGDPARVTLTPSGAPVAFTAPELERSDYRAEVEAGVRGPVGRAGQVSLGAGWTPLGAAETLEARLSFLQRF